MCLYFTKMVAYYFTKMPALQVVLVLPSLLEFSKEISSVKKATYSRGEKCKKFRRPRFPWPLSLFFHLIWSFVGSPLKSPPPHPSGRGVTNCVMTSQSKQRIGEKLYFSIHWWHNWKSPTQKQHTYLIIMLRQISAQMRKQMVHHNEFTTITI